MPDMKPGPELDALVAEKVMGWRWNIRNGVCYADRTGLNAPDVWEAWSPSTSIADAWEVVEKLVAEGWEPTISFDPGWQGGDWEVCVERPHVEGVCRNAPTAPHAICLAALSAVGVDDAEG